MNNLTHIILLVLLATCASIVAQEVPAGSAKQPVPSAETEASLVEDAINESSNGLETAAAEAVEIAEEVEEPVWVKRREVVKFGSDNRIGPNERTKDMLTIAGNSIVEGRVDGDMVTIAGNSIVEGRVDGDMVTIWGDSTVTGYVDDDFVVILGSAELGPDAVLDGDAVVIGGKFTVHPNAKIDGQRVSIPLYFAGMPGKFKEVREFIRECVFLARPISPHVTFTLYLAGIFLLFYILLAVIFPKPLQRTHRALEDKPLQSFLVGTLVYASGPLFLLLMAISVIGLVLVPFVKLAVLALAFFGKAVVFFYMGKQIARAIHQPVLENAILSIILGAIIVYALYMIPFFGFFLWLVLSTLGLGAVCIAIGNSISKWKAAGQAGPPVSAVESSPQVTSESGASASHLQEPVQPGASLGQVDSATAVLFRKVGFWWRTLATLIDLILIGALVLLLDITMFLIPLFAYFIVFWGWKGSTLGGMALGIRVQKISGEPLDWSTAVIRSLSATVSLLPCFLGFFWAAWDPENQSWHDKIAGTTAVRIPRGYTWN